MHHPLPKPLELLPSPFQKFFDLEASGGILLMLSSAIALIWANIDWQAYHHLWEQKISVELIGFRLEKSLHFWINDGLMAVFFFLVGLEIKREVIVGELSSPKNAALPISAAIGGMVFPAALFIILIPEGPAADGWGIPMATDIAFSLGILKLLGKRIPISLVVLLTALAIVDDIGAILVIAIFYSSGIDWISLAWGAGAIAVLVGFSLLRLRVLSVYLLFTLIAWFFFLKAGIHPTIAGVLAAFTIPANPKIGLNKFIRIIRNHLAPFKESDDPKPVLLTSEQLSAIDSLEAAAERVQSPLQRLENHLHGWVIYFIIPIFALANAGVYLGAELPESPGLFLSFGIAISLVLGKLTGILSFSWVSVKLGLAKLPEKTGWLQITGVALLAGIGFTMAIFIAQLAYEDEGLRSLAKIGIIGASLFAGLTGYILLRIKPTSASPAQDSP